MVSSNAVLILRIAESLSGPQAMALQVDCRNIPAFHNPVCMCITPDSESRWEVAFPQPAGDGTELVVSSALSLHCIAWPLIVISS